MPEHGSPNIATALSHIAGRAAWRGQWQHEGVPPLPPENDAFGAALMDHLAGRAQSELVLEVDDGYQTPAMPAASFFLPPDSWSKEEREVLAIAPLGPVLDLGAGAGRHALYFQALGRDVTAVDISPGAMFRYLDDVRRTAADERDQARLSKWRCRPTSRDVVSRLCHEAWIHALPRALT